MVLMAVSWLSLGFLMGFSPKQASTHHQAPQICLLAIIWLACSLLLVARTRWYSGKYRALTVWPTGARGRARRWGVYMCYICSVCQHYGVRSSNQAPGCNRIKSSFTAHQQLIHYQEAPARNPVPGGTRNKSSTRGYPQQKQC